MDDIWTALPKLVQVGLYVCMGIVGMLLAGWVFRFVGRTIDRLLKMPPFNEDETVCHIIVGILACLALALFLWLMGSVIYLGIMIGGGIMTRKTLLALFVLTLLPISVTWADKYPSKSGPACNFSGSPIDTNWIWLRIHPTFAGWVAHAPIDTIAADIQWGMGWVILEPTLPPLPKVDTVIVHDTVYVAAKKQCCCCETRRRK